MGVKFVQRMLEQLPDSYARGLRLPSRSIPANNV
jgi:hypothetical protein